MRKKRLQKVVALLMVVAMILNLTPSGLSINAADDEKTATVEEESETEPAEESGTSTAGAAELISGTKLADLDRTTEYTKTLGSNDSTEYTGRVWTDKSVFTESKTFTVSGSGTDRDVTVTKSDDADFLVSYSALSTSLSVTGETETPVDVVFIIDISGSMAWTMDGESTATTLEESRIYAAVDALNTAISSLMTMNENNRVAVVAYSSYGRVLLPLAHYSSTANDGTYLTTKLTTSQQGGGGGGQTTYSYTVSLGATNTSTETAATGTYNVTGGTNIQHGLYVGMNLLATETSTTVTLTDGTVVSRTPFTVLLSDGAATYSANSASWWAPNTTSTQGPGGSAYYGNGMLAMMTGAYMKNAINSNYGITSTTDSRATKLYTIGVGLEGLSGNDLNLANIVMNPSVYWSADNTIANSIRSAWSTYSGGSSVRIQVNANSYYTLAHPTSGLTDVTSISDYVNTYYATDSATSLTEAFKSIVNEISVSTATVPTNVTEASPSTSGYIRYTDPIGEYMEVKDVNGILYDGKLYTTKTVTEDAETNTVQYVFSDKVMSPVYGEQSLSDIRITVSTDSSGNQTLYIYIPASVIPVRINYVTLDEEGSIETHTQDDIYPIRILYSVGLSEDVDRDTLEGVSDEYIKANSNEDGSVNFYANLYTGQEASEVDKNGTVTVEGTVGNATTQFYPATSNRFYYTQDDNLLYTSEDCANGTEATSFTADDTVYYYKLTYYEGTTLATKYESVTGEVLSHENVIQGTDGYYYIEAGSSRLSYLQEFETEKADQTTTGTSDYYYYPTYDSTTGEITNYLGNNGVMAMGGTGSLSISKSVTADEGLTAPTKSFTFTVSLTDASGVALTGSYDYTIVNAGGETASTGTIANGGTISLEDGQTATIADLPVKTKYIVTESAVSGFTVTATGDTVNGSTVSGEISYVGEDDTASFTNNYSVNTETLKGETAFAGTKILNGREWNSTDSYTFVIESARENIPMPDETEITVTAEDVDYATGNAPFSFGDITYDTPGEYVYYITETTPATASERISGITYSRARYRVTVTVTDNGDGTLSVTPAMEQTYTDDYTENATPVSVDSADFTNTYTADSVTWYPAGVKSYTDNSGDNNPIQNGMFTFQISPAGDNAANAPMPSDATGDGAERVAAVNNTIHEVYFAGITFTHEMIGNTYTYEVEEVIPYGATKNEDGTWTLNGMTYDGNTYTVKVIVGQDSETGAIVLDVTYPNNGSAVTFTNSYTPTPTNAMVTGSKTLTGRDMKVDESFTFTLTPANTLATTEFGSGYTLTATASGGTDGSAVPFSFNEMAFSKPGTYLFTVTETAGSTATGLTYDTNVATVTVTVTDTDGVLSASVSYSNSLYTDETSAAVFKNTYTATFDTSTAVTVTGTKELTGKRIDTNEFYFEVTAKSTGTTSYVGSTAATTASSATTDGYSVYTSAMTLLSNITYTAAGEYVYTMKEYIPATQATGMTYDTSLYKVTVTVTDDLNGRLYVSSTLIEKSTDGGSTYSTWTSGIVFSNVYKPLSTTVTAPVTTKVLEGDRSYDLTAGEFGFTISVTPLNDSPSDGCTLPATTTVTNAADGKVTFGEITFTKVGTYRVEINETAGTDDSIKYDTATKYVVYSVVDVNGQLVARVQSQSDDLSFTNTYNTKVTVEGEKYLTVTKDFTGRENNQWLNTDTFTFYLIARGDVTQAAIDAGYITLPENASTGITITSSSTNYSEAFGDIVITKPGTYNFAVYEDGSNQITGVEYDTANRIVTIVATDKGDGNMDIEVSYSIVTDSASGTTEAVSNLTFYNEYKTGETTLDGETYLKVEKTFTGRENDAWLTSDSFTFTIAAGDETTRKAVNAGAITLPSDVVVTVLNDKIAHFGSITFANTNDYKVATTNGSVYTFTVKEVLPTGATEENSYTVNGITYDASEKTIYVVVTDNRDGTLTATLLDGTNNNYTDGTNPLKSDDLSFTNTYSADKVTTEGLLDMTVTKVIEGRNWISTDTFTFYLGTSDTDTQDAIDAGYVVLPTETSLTITNNTVNHTATFGDITFTKAGTYEFIIGETLGSIANMSYDTHEASFTVVVEDNEKGELVVTGVFDDQGAEIEITGSLTFTNTFSPDPIEVTGTKTWIDGGKKHDNANEITLTLYRKIATDTDWTEVDATATWNGNTYTFSNLDQFDANAEEYTYKVEETAISGYTTEYDSTHLNITNRLIPEESKTSKDSDGTQIDGEMVSACDVLTYEINWTNAIRNSSGEATGTYSATVTITDTLPAGLEVDESSISDNGTYDSTERTITWKFTDLATDDIAQGTVSFNATVASDEASEAELVNTATILETNVTVEVDNYVPVKTVTVDDSDGDEEARVGKELTYTVTFKNTEDAASDVTITDVLDSTLTYTTGTASSGTGTVSVVYEDSNGAEATMDCSVTFTENGQTLTWVIAGVPAGAAGSVTFTAKINESAAGETIDNNATVKVGSHEATTNTVPVTVVKPGTLTLSGSKTLVGRGIESTDSFTFKIEAGDEKTDNAITAKLITIGNSGTANADVTNASNATDGKTGTASFTFGEITFTQAGTYTFKVTEERGQLTNVTYDGTVYVVTVAVSDNGNGVLSAVVTGIADSASKSYDDISFTNTYYDVEKAKSVEFVTVDAETGETSTANIDGQLVGMDEILTYTIDWVNTEVDVDGVPTGATITITDKIPEGTDYVTDSAATYKVGSGDGTATVTYEYDTATRTITWIIEADAAAYGSVSFEVEVTADAFDNTEPQIKNTAKVKIGENGVEQTTNTTNNYVPVKSASVETESSQLRPNDEITYTVTFKNTATTGTNSILVTDTIPDGLAYKNNSYKVTVGETEVNASLVTFAQDGQKLSWTLTNITAGADVVVSFVAVAQVDVPTTVRNEAFVDGHKSNYVITPIPAEDAKHVLNEDVQQIDGEVVSAGDVLLYEISWTNEVVSGGMTYYADAVTITDTLPAGVTVKEASITQGGVLSNDGTTITWEITGLDTNSITRGTVTFEVTVDGTVNTVENTAVISYNSYTETKTVGVDNTVPVKDVYEAGSTDSANGETVLVGDVLTYEVSYTNPAEHADGSEGAAANITITDAAPAGTSYVDGSATFTVTQPGSGGSVEEIKNQFESVLTVVDGGLTWNFESVPAGATVTVTFEVEVTNAALDNSGNQVANTANVTVDDTPVVTREVVNYVVDKDVAVSTNPTTSVDGQIVGVNDTLIYTIDWANTATDDTTGVPVAATVVVKDEIPKGTVFVANSDTDISGIAGASVVYHTRNGGTTTSVTTQEVADTVSYIVWTIPATAGASGELSFSVKVTDDAVKNTDNEITNTAEITVGSHDPIVTNETTNYVPEKTVEVSNSDGDSEARVGMELTYTVSFKNTETAASTVTITDVLESTLTYKEGSATTGTVTVSYQNANGDNATASCTVTFEVDASGALKWTVADVPAGATGSVSFIATINEGAEGETINNKATVKVGDHEATTNTVPVTVVNPDTVSLDGIKTLAGRSMESTDSFSFTVEATGDDTIAAVEAGTVVIGGTSKAMSETTDADVTNATNGDKTGTATFSFSDITFSAAGTYTFKVTEVVPADSGKLAYVGYDGTVYTVTVEVTDTGNGVMEATVKTITDSANSAKDEIVFTNTYYNEKDAKSVTQESASGETKEIDGELVGVGETLTYTIDWMNTAVDASGVPIQATITIKDTIPDGTSFVVSSFVNVISSGIISASYDEDTRTITWLITANAAAYGSVSFDVIVTENAVNNTDQKITNQATVEVGNSKYETNTTTNYVPKKTASVDSDTLKVGDVITYSITFRNTAGTAENSIAVEDTLAEGLEYVANSATVQIGSNSATKVEPDVTTLAASGQKKLSWTLTNVAVDATVTVTFEVKVTEDADANVSNQAVVDGHKSNTEITPVPSEDEKHVLDTAGDIIDGEAVSAGQTLTYKITWTNEAVADGSTYYADTVTVTDTLPVGVTLASYDQGDASEVTYNANAGENGTITWTFEGLSTEKIERGTITFTVMVDGTADTIENTAIISANDYNKTASVTNTVPVKEVYEAEDTTISENGEVVYVGTVLTYEVSYTNLSKKDAGTADFTITDAAPAGTEYVEGSAKGTVTDANGNDITDSITIETSVADNGTITWSYKEVPEGATVTGTFEVTVTEAALENAGNRVENQAEVTIDGDDPVSTRKVVNYVVDKDVALADDPTVSVDGQMVGVGDTLTYTVDWANTAVDANGNPAAAKVVVADDIPDGTVLVPGSVPASGAVSVHYLVNENGGYYETIETAEQAAKVIAIEWTFDAAAGASGTVSFKVTVSEDAVDYDGVSNTATIKVGEDDPVSTNETVNEVPEKTVALVTENEEGETENEDVTEVEVGQVLAYTITFHNTDGEGASATVIDTLSQGLQYVTGSAAVTVDDAAYSGGDEATADDSTPIVDGQTLTWNLVNLAEDADVTITFEALVTMDALGSVDNTARVAGHKSNTTTTPVADKDEKDVTDGDVDKTTGETTSIDGTPVNVGDELTYVIYWTNDTGETATVTVTDKVPANTTFVKDSNTSTVEGGTFGIDEGTGVLTWTFADQPAGTHGMVTFKVTVDNSAAGTTVKNTATIEIGENESKVTKTTNETENDVPGEPEETPLKTVSESSKAGSEFVEINEDSKYVYEDVNVGSEITYEIEYYNYNVTAATITITDELDPDVEFVSASGTLKSADTENEKVVYELITDASGKVTKVIWTIQAEKFERDTVKLIVKVLDSAKAIGEDEDTATVENVADVQIGEDPENTWTSNIVVNPITPEDPEDPTKTVSESSPNGYDATATTDESGTLTGGSLAIGDIVEYDITYYNNNNTVAVVTIKDTLDPGVDFVKATGVEKSKATADDQIVYELTTDENGIVTVTWTITGVAPFSGDKVTLQVQVNEKAKLVESGEEEATVSNTASVQIGNDTAVDTNTVENPIDPDDPSDPSKVVAADSEGAGGASVSVGDEVTYIISYYNNESVSADVTIIDVLDSGADFVKATGTEKSKATDADTVVYEVTTDADGKVTVTWTITDVAPFTAGNVKLTVKVNENAKKITDGETQATIANTASVKIGNDPAVNTNTAENPIDPDDPTDPTKTIITEGVKEGDTVEAGDVLTYEIGYYNHTNKVATVTVTDKLDAGVDYKSSTDGGVYDKATHTVTWTLTVDPFTEGNVSVTIEVNETAEAQISNTAYVKIENDSDSDTDTENPGGSDEPDDGTPTNTVTNPVKEEEPTTPEPTTQAPTQPVATTSDTGAVVPYTVMMLMAFAAIIILLKARREENA